MRLEVFACEGGRCRSTWGLRHVARRPAANLPGRSRSPIDPSLLDELRGKCAQGSVITVGTNGKTSTSNLLADAFEAAGHYHLQSHRGESGCGHHLGASAAAGCPVGRFRMRRAVAAHVLPRLRSNMCCC